jgi:lysozyme
VRIALLGASLVAIVGIVAALYKSGAVQLTQPDPAVFPVVGIDVSHHQGEVDWKRVAEAGISFAYVKSSEGQNFRDTRFEENWAASAGAGIPRGAYHFFTFCSPGKPQAEHFLMVAPPSQDALPPVADVEFVGNCSSHGELTKVREELRQFLRMIEEAWQVKPILYLTPDALERVLGSELAEYPVWIRSVFSQPDLDDYRAWVLWQFSDNSRVDGIEGPVDRNALRPGLTLRDLRRPAAQPAAPADRSSARRNRLVIPFGLNHGVSGEPVIGPGR